MSLLKLPPYGGRWLCAAVENRGVELLRLDILTLFTLPMYYLLFWGLYIALKRTNET